MTNREAMEIVLSMAEAELIYSGLTPDCEAGKKQHEAIFQVQDYMNDLMREERLIIRAKPATGCDYGIGG